MSQCHRRKDDSIIKNEVTDLKSAFGRIVIYYTRLHIMVLTDSSLSSFSSGLSPLNGLISLLDILPWLCVTFFGSLIGPTKGRILFTSESITTSWKRMQLSAYFRIWAQRNASENMIQEEEDARARLESFDPFIE